MPSASIATSVEIQAPANKVWSTFSDLGKLHEWNSFIKIEPPSAGVVVGSKLDVTLKHSSPKPFKVQPEVLVFGQQQAGDGAHELRWRGKLFSDWLFVGEHFFRVVPGASKGSTRFEHGEEFGGLLIPLLGGMLRDTKNEFNNFNTALKMKVEGKKK